MEQTLNIQVTDTATAPSTGFFTNLSSGNATANNTLLIAIFITVAAIILYLLFFKKKKSILIPLCLSFLTTSTLLLTTNLQSTSSTTPPTIIPAGETINLEVQKDGSATTTTLFTTDTLSMYILNSHLSANLPEGITLEINSTPLSEVPTEISPETHRKTQELTIRVSADESVVPGDYTTTAIHEITETKEFFAFTIDTRMTNTPDTDPTHYDGTETKFTIPTGSWINGMGAKPYDWIVDWGDETQPEIATGLSGDPYLVSHDYAVPGEYQIIITPNGPTTEGWFDGWGNLWERYFPLIKSIDAPITDLMRTGKYSNRFAVMFNMMPNLTTIPRDLFKHIETKNEEVAHMFAFTFEFSATNSSTASVPADLFASVDTTGATHFDSMFSWTFPGYGSHSPNLTLPKELFASIDTSDATSIESMFDSTFSSFAASNPNATIPQGLFDTINTSNVSNFRYAFNQVFNYFARSSTVATIPQGLFDSISTANATNTSDMFNIAFKNFGESSTVASIPKDLFSQIDLSSIMSAYDFGASRMFEKTFFSFAPLSQATTDINSIWGDANFAGKVSTTTAGGSFNGVFHQTFLDMPSLTGEASTFIADKLDNVIPTISAQTFRGTSVSDLATLHDNWK